jgi:aralkylamine N-acetyltransferase
MPEYVFMEHPDPRQLEQIKALYRQEGWWDERDDADPRLIEKIVEGSHCFMTAQVNGAVIGMGRAISDGVADAYIQDVTVEKSERGRGIAQDIVARLVARLYADGVSWVALIAAGRSRKLYEKLGFAAMPAAAPMLHHREP